MAAVRAISRIRNWKFTAAEIESLFRGEFAAAHRHDAGALLRVTVPDQAEERELLIRMSLAIGTFTMGKDVASVAQSHFSYLPAWGGKFSAQQDSGCSALPLTATSAHSLVTSEVAEVHLIQRPDKTCTLFWPCGFSPERPFSLSRLSHASIT